MKSNPFTRRQFLKSASLSALGLALAACAPKATEGLPAPTVDSQSSESTAVPQPTDAPPSAANIKITVWGWWEDRMKLFQNAGDKFTTKMPNFTVEVNSIDKDLWTKVYASVPAGTGPTLCKMIIDSYFKLVDQQLIIKLDETTFPEDWLKTKFPNHTWDSYGTYVCPEGDQPAISMYNKAMFKEVGLDPEAPPKSWDEYVAAAKKLTKTDDTGAITVQGTTFEDWVPQLNMLYQQGGNMVKREGDKVIADFNTPEMEVAWMFFDDAFKTHKIWDPNFPYFTDSIGTAKAAMSINAAWGYGEVQSSYPDVFKDLAAAAPPLPNGELKQYYGHKNSVLGLAALVNRPNDEIEAGGKFLEFLYKEDLDSQLAVSTIAGLAPAHADNLIRKEVIDNPFLKLSVDLAKEEYDTVDLPEDLIKLFNDGMTMLTANGQTVKEVLEFGQTQMQKLIDDGQLKRIR